MAAKKRKKQPATRRKPAAAKTASKKKPSASRRSGDSASTSLHGLLRASEFVQAVISHVQAFGTNDRWPAPRANPEATSAEFAALSQVLLLVYHEQSVPQGLPAKAAQLADFLASRDWPNTSHLPQLPAKYSEVPVPVLKLVQVSVILDGLLALVSGDHPGGPKQWPVHP